MEITNGWHTPPKEVMSDYCERCEFYSLNDFSNFKRDTKYNTILEGNEKIVGDIALQSIKNYGGFDYLVKNIDKFKENEQIGNPQKFIYDGIEVAPSTLRYVNSLLEIKRLNINPKKIIEIGGGYGGLCKILSTEFIWDEYIIIDILPATKLCNKYLQAMKLNAKAVTEYDGESDLVIADSSLAECNLETQEKYAKLINKSKSAYIVYNTLHIAESARFYNAFISKLIGFNMKIELTNGGVNVIYLSK